MVWGERAPSWELLEKENRQRMGIETLSDLRASRSSAPLRALKATISGLQTYCCNMEIFKD